MNVLVTGGAGYIGSVICDQLLAEGHGVVVLDNLSKGHRDAVAPSAAFVEADLLETPAVSDALTRHHVDAVVHMAASSLVGESMGQPLKYYRNNLWATLGLLEAMTYSGTRHLVFSSTAAVYGNPEKQPIEEDDPTVPTNPYGETKLAVERALHWHSLSHDLRYISLRYFNAAGATDTRGERHSPETHLIPLVLEAAAKNTSVAVFGNDYPTPDGTCVRDYIHVSDLARAHVMALKALASGKPSATFNLGCGQGYSVKEVIDSAERVTGRSIKIDMQGRRAGDPAVLIASSAQIRDTLGWTPRSELLDDIVGSAWKWMRKFDTTAARYSSTQPAR
jgi:UDP-glucose 4-epimerase